MHESTLLDTPNKNEIAVFWSLPAKSFEHEFHDEMQQTKDYIGERLPTWLGRMLVYRTSEFFCNPKLKKHTPLFMIKADTTVEQFMEEVEKLIKNSGDTHHIFIEGFEEDQCFLNIFTGS